MAERLPPRPEDGREGGSGGRGEAGAGRLTREMVIGIKMKDIFSNKSLFMRGGNDLYAEFD